MKTILFALMIVANANFALANGLRAPARPAPKQATAGQAVLTKLITGSSINLPATKALQGLLASGTDSALSASALLRSIDSSCNSMDSGCTVFALALGHAAVQNPNSVRAPAFPVLANMIRTGNSDAAARILVSARNADRKTAGNDFIEQLYAVMAQKLGVGALEVPLVLAKANCTIN